MTTGVVSAIHLHPIKSCHRVVVSAATVSDTGLVGDREWQVSTGTAPLTQRKHPALATVQPEPIDGGLRISAPGRPTIEVARPMVNDTTTVALIGVEVPVGDAGDAAAAWFSDVVGTEVRLVALTERSELRLPGGLDVFGQPISFGDLAPVLVTNTASLRWLVERADKPFGMERFRPNLVVDTDEPFAEDTWARFRLGAAQVTHGLAWARCSIPQIDQDSGRRGKEPARVLKHHRWCDEAPDLPEDLRAIVANSGLFGVGCAVGPAGTVIRVGDELVVSETREPLIPNPALA